MVSDSCNPPGFSPEQREILARRGIDEETARAAGVLPVPTEADLPDGTPDYWTVEKGYLPGLLFRYCAPGGDCEWQLRPDTPVTNGKGHTAKYVFASGAKSLLHSARPIGTVTTVDGVDVEAGTDGVLIIEGTCQAIAGARWAPAGWAVYGIAGCQSWMSAGVPVGALSVADGRTVLVCLDADAATNWNVYTAGERLGMALRAQSAEQVMFIRLPAGGKAGLDDVLAEQAPERRTRYLEGLIELTMSLPKAEKPQNPARKRPLPKKGRAANNGAGGDSHEGGGDEDACPWFAPGQGLLVQQITEDIMKEHPFALTTDNKLVLYVNGVYSPGDLGVLSAVTDRLGDAFRKEHSNNVEAFMTGEAARLGWRIPERTKHPLLNVENGMLNILTGELLPHDPKYLSAAQFPVMWDPEAKAPLYEEWLTECVGELQLDDLEESIAVMLDPTITPSKAVFLFGPSRSGKSTMLDLIKAMAGATNTGGVSLHQLVSNKFMAARVFGKVVNISADLSAAHLDDLSIFKLMTGEDVVEADPKYGRPFTFTNRALFAFSANELPTVGESSRAYSERIRPFHFGRSFAGAEDVTMRERLKDELPGILVRWVIAYQRWRARGRYLETVPEIRETFEIESDRVRKWVAERMEIIPAEAGQKIDGGMTRKEIMKSFGAWAEENGSTSMGMGKIVSRLLTVPGVAEVRDRGRNSVRVINICLRPESDWGIKETAPRIKENRTNGALDHETGAEGAVSNHSESSQNAYIFERSNGRSTSDEYIDAPVLEKNASKLPLLPPAPEAPKTDPMPVVNHFGPASERKTHPVIHDLISRYCVDDPGRCPTCGTTYVLVDHTWGICPRCNPAVADLLPKGTS